MAGPGLSCEQVMMISLSGVFFAQSMAVLSAFLACSDPSYPTTIFSAITLPSVSSDWRINNGRTGSSPVNITAKPAAIAT